MFFRFTRDLRDMDFSYVEWICFFAASDSTIFCLGRSLSLPPAFAPQSHRPAFSRSCPPFGFSIGALASFALQALNLCEMVARRHCMRPDST